MQTSIQSEQRHSLLALDPVDAQDVKSILLEFQLKSPGAIGEFLRFLCFLWDVWKLSASQPACWQPQ